MIREDFAAAGGVSEGLRLAGADMEQVDGIEIEPDACATARAAGHRRERTDVRAVRGRNWSRMTGYSGGPPCQTFSVAGKGDGRKHLSRLGLAVAKVANGALPEDAVASVEDSMLDERSVLVLEPMHVIARWRPQWVMLEQVPAVLPIWQAYAEQLDRLGYSVQTGILKAEQYGVPQTRRRAILVAHQDREATLPTPTHSEYYPRTPERIDPGTQRWLSMADALGWGMTARPSMTVMGGGTATGGAEPFGNGARKGMLRELEAGRWQMAAAGATSRYTAGQVPRDLDRPSHTITGKGTAYWTPKDGVERHSARSALRVSAHECAVLQSFRADYPWHGRLGSQYQQVGNAHPPLMAAAILLELVGSARMLAAA